MRAARVLGRRSIETARLPLPEPGAGEVRVRIEACGICGSDLHLFDAGLYPPGQTPGHEMAGRVDCPGAGVTGWSPGDRVAVEPLRTCGSCPCCRAGRDSICSETRLHGVHEPGGLAEYAVVPAIRLFRAPADLEPRLVALAEPAAVVVHALRRAGLARGARALVLGAGSVGLLTLAAARRLGANEVWITARHPHQAARARALGADRVLEAEAATAAGLAALGREAPVDVVVETVGARADTLAAAGAAVRPGGVVAVVGFFVEPLRLDALPLMLKEVTLAWSYCYGHADPDGRGPDFAEALALLDAERAALAPLVTDTFPLDEVARAFARAADRRAGSIKVSVVP
jgi:2-desacetyl-2-hydroxyethyl bacteriochlorophyllide A dehydrogenase